MKKLKPVLFILVLALASCQKDKMTPKTNAPTAVAIPNGIYILNQGQLYGANSSLTSYNIASKTLVPDQYGTANGASLGITANDIEIYGSKMYIAVTNSSVVDIVDTKTAKLIKQDSIVRNANQGQVYLDDRQPRSIAFYQGNAFITCYDGTVAVIDTATFAITKNIQIGAQTYPEGLVVANKKLYVADYGGLLCNLVSVIDLTTLTVIKTIIVMPGPISMAADAYGNVYAASTSDDNFEYPYPIPPNYPVYTVYGGMVVINSKTDLVTSKLQTPADLAINSERTNLPITVQGDLVYYPVGKKIAVFNAKTQTPVTASFITDGTSLTLPTAIAANPATGEIYITNDGGLSNGSLYAFDKTGKLEYTAATGIRPVKIVLLGN
jgi:YVTN family beta-propeller protein